MPTKTIVALGNPGTDYTRTRHNVAWLFLGHYQAVRDCSAFTESRKFLAHTTTCNNTLFLMPTTYMNASGDSVIRALTYYKHTPQEHLIVIHDDLDLRLGEYKISRNRGAAGHGGVAHITHMCGTQDYTRLRIGIDNRTDEERAQISGRDYVLGNFSSDERKSLSDLFTILIPLLDDLIIKK